METSKNVNFSPNSVAYKGKTINRREIHSVEYGEPKSVVMAIISNLFKYLIFMLLVVGIPFAILAVIRDIKKYRVIITWKEYEKNNKRKETIWYMEKDDFDYFKSNY